MRATTTLWLTGSLMLWGCGSPTQVGVTTRAMMVGADLGGGPRCELGTWDDGGGGSGGGGGCGDSSCGGGGGGGGGGGPGKCPNKFVSSPRVTTVAYIQDFDPRQASFDLFAQEPWKTWIADPNQIDLRGSIF